MSVYRPGMVMICDRKECLRKLWSTILMFDQSEYFEMFCFLSQAAR